MGRVGELCESADGSDALDLVLLLLNAVSLLFSDQRGETHGVDGGDLLVVLNVPLEHLRDKIVNIESL